MRKEDNDAQKRKDDKNPKLYPDEGKEDLRDMMLPNVSVDDKHEYRIPIDLGMSQGSYGVTVKANDDMDMDALADPGGIDPAYEEEQFSENMKKIKRRVLR